MSRVGRYDIAGVIGSGGFGTVYVGVDPSDGDRVAVKVLDTGSATDPTLLARLHSEAAAMRKVADANCVRVRDVITEGEVAAIVTDYVDGASLRVVLDRHGRLTGPQAVDVLRGALRGLVAVHRAGLLHGDLKPDNILVDRRGVSQLIDFGLAAAPPAVSARADRLTGSPAYLSPEQVRGEPADVRSDVYACAVMLFELLCGRRPYGGADRQAVLDAHLHAPVPDPRAAEPSISPAFAGLCMRGLAKERSARPAGAAEFLAELESAARQQYGAAWRTGLGLGALAGGLIGTGTLPATPAATGQQVATAGLRWGRRLSTRALTAAGAVVVTTAAVVAVVVANSGTTPTAAGRCSDPNPSPVELLFAGVVCVQHIAHVAQPDGSVELELTVAVTNKDPNTFGVRTWDFAVVDTAGHSVEADDAKSAGRRGARNCVYQQPISDDGWPLRPGNTFTIPGQVCFNLAPGEVASELTWQDDVVVPLRP